MSKDIQKRNSILDLETGEMHEITEERQKIAAQLMMQVTGAVFAIGAALKRIFDGKFYLEMGYSSREEFCNSALPFGKRQAFKYVSIANRFESYYQQHAALESGEDVSQTKQIGGLGMNKLYDLTTLPEDEFDALMAGDDEAALSLEAVQDMTAKEVTKQVKAIKDKYSGKLAQLDEENRLLKEEAKANSKTVEEAEERIEQAIAIEREFGAPAGKMREKKAYIAEAHELLNRANELLHKCGVVVEDPESVQEDFINAFRKVQTIVTRLELNYMDVLQNAAGVE